MVERMHTPGCQLPLYSTHIEVTDRGHPRPPIEHYYCLRKRGSGFSDLRGVRIHEYGLDRVGQGLGWEGIGLGWTGLDLRGRQGSAKSLHAIHFYGALGTAPQAPGLHTSKWYTLGVAGAPLAP